MQLIINKNVNNSRVVINHAAKPSPSQHKLGIQNTAYMRFSNSVPFMSKVENHDLSFGSITDKIRSKFSNLLDKVNYKAFISDFKSYSYDDFRNWMVGQNLTAEEVINNSIKPENLLGEGSYHIVYAVSGNDKYVIRFQKNKIILLDDLKPVENDFNLMNIGHIVAEIGGYKIHKRQIGIPAGVPSKLNVDSIEAQGILYEHLIRTEKLPQPVFDDFAETLKSLNKSGRSFDRFNPNNILVDELAGKFNIVDDLYKQKTKNSVIDMICPLLNFSQTWIASEFKPDLVNCRRSILKKCLMASERVKLPLPDVFDDNMMDAFKLAGMQGSWIDIHRNLSAFRKNNYFSIKDIEKYLDQAFDNK